MLIGEDPVTALSIRYYPSLRICSALPKYVHSGFASDGRSALGRGRRISVLPPSPLGFFALVCNFDFNRRLIPTSGSHVRHSYVNLNTEATLRVCRTSRRRKCRVANRPKRTQRGNSTRRFSSRNIGKYLRYRGQILGRRVVVRMLYDAI